MKPECACCNRDLSESPSIWVEDAYYCFFHTKQKIKEIYDIREYELIREHEVYYSMNIAARLENEAREQIRNKLARNYAKTSLKGLMNYVIHRKMLEHAIDTVVPPVRFPRIPPKDIETEIQIELSEYASEPVSYVGYDRRAILKRDGYTCQNCMKEFKEERLEVHHVMPVSKGGSDSLRNLVTLCIDCHKAEDMFGHVHRNSVRALFPEMDLRREADERFRRMERIRLGIKSE